MPPDPAALSDLSLSNDGSLVAYVRGVARKHNDNWMLKPQIWLMNSDGSNQRMLHDGGAALGIQGRDVIGSNDPEISPDNRSVVFSHTNTEQHNFPSMIDEGHDLWTMNIDGTGLRRLTQPGPISIIPDWGNDKILYTEYSDADKYCGLVLINTDGTGKRRLEEGIGLWRGGRHGKFIP